MKEIIMSEWQITQLFLSETGVHEVYVNLDSKKLKCNCDGFSTRSACKHVIFVSKRMKANGGVYPVQISNKASESESTLASLDPKMFREFLLKYGKIEAL
jgi:hypothetical protein